MDLPETGSHCPVVSCNVLDLLPIKCSHCLLLFCRQHAHFESHECSAADNAIGRPRSDWSERSLCDKEKCENLSLAGGSGSSPQLSTNTGRCERCDGSFCAAHRHPDMHSCIFIPTPALSSAKNPEAHALLAKHFPSVNSSSTPDHAVADTKAKTIDPAKLKRLRDIQIVKMRHKAIAGDPKDAKGSGVSIHDRIHVRVECTIGAPTTHGAKILWFRKSIVTGRALDLIATHFKLTSASNGRPSLCLTLTAESEGAPLAPLRTDQPFCDQIVDGADVTLRHSIAES